MDSFFHSRRQPEDVLKTMITEIIHIQKAAPTETLWNSKLPRQQTIPIILFTQENMTPFVGAGFAMQTDADGKDYYACVESPIFKVVDFISHTDNWVQLQLLRPVVDPLVQRAETLCSSVAHPSFCDNYGIEKIASFIETGVSITVSLARFGGITCLARGAGDA